VWPTRLPPDFASDRAARPDRRVAAAAAASSSRARRRPAAARCSDASAWSLGVERAVAWIEAGSVGNVE
jgi:hypothetical protein